MAASNGCRKRVCNGESSVNSAINTATTIVGTPLQWLDVLVTSVLSGAVALAVGLLAIIVLSLLAWWRPISIAPFMRWVVAAAVGAAVAYLYVADSSAKFGAATWPYWLCAVVIVIAVLLLLAMGMIAAMRSWIVARASAQPMPAVQGDSRARHARRRRWRHVRGVASTNLANSVACSRSVRSVASVQRAKSRVTVARSTNASIPLRCIAATPVTPSPRRVRLKRQNHQRRCCRYLLAYSMCRNSFGPCALDLRAEHAGDEHLCRRELGAEHAHERDGSAAFIPCRRRRLARSSASTRRRARQSPSQGTERGAFHPVAAALSAAKSTTAFVRRVLFDQALYLGYRSGASTKSAGCAARA